MPYCRVTPACGKVAEAGIEPSSFKLMRFARGPPLHGDSFLILKCISLFMCFASMAVCTKNVAFINF